MDKKDKPSAKVEKNKNELAKIPNADGIIIEDDGQRLYDQLSALIEHSRRSMYAQINNANVLHFWEVGRHINIDILENKRADYGKKVVARVAARLTEKYGQNYVVRNLRRMMQFAEQFPDFEIVSMVSTQLSWSHFIEILPLKTTEAKVFYLRESSRSLLGVRELRKMINRKAYERNEIADSQISTGSPIPFGTFKDPYLLDELEMKSEFQEADLEDAILRELEKFILEFGKGFAFVDRQKRIILDGKDRYIDLLFYNRDLKRLVAVELKIGPFQAEHKGKMQLYLAWLDKYERREGEESPVGIILCSESGREEMELLKLDQDGILVAEYWTALPPKAEFEQKIQTILAETRERMARRNMLIESSIEAQDE